MASARPLREVFADLVGTPSATDDPAALLSGHGHPGLPDDLVAEAVVSYAETAPLEVAEQLAPYVTAHSAVGTSDDPGAGWLDLLGAAPDVSADEPADLDGLTPAHSDPAAADPETGLNDDDAAGLDFGTGAGSVSAIEPVAVDEGSAPDDLVEMPAAGLTVDDFDTEDFGADDLDDDDLDDDGEPDDEPLG